MDTFEVLANNMNAKSESPRHRRERHPVPKNPSAEKAALEASELPYFYRYPWARQMLHVNL